MIRWVLEPLADLLRANYFLPVMFRRTNTKVSMTRVLRKRCH